MWFRLPRNLWLRKEHLSQIKKSSKCYHQEQIKWSGDFVSDEIIKIITGTKYTPQGK
jgi:hypothetical protein